MASSNTGGPRTERLRKLFAAFTNGRRSVSSITEAQHFLESAQAQASPSRCLEDLSTVHGLESVRKSVRISSSASFICSYVLPFISYLADSDARAICEGDLLQQVIATIVEPTTVWRAITSIYLADGFPNKLENTQSFAWLGLLVATHPGAQLTASTELSDILDQRPLINVSDSKTKSLGYQIQKALQLRFDGSNSNDPNGPGGRHDNDFADFRDIAVYPTNDEFTSTLKPYYRSADEIAKIGSSDRARCHLDNQFRLLREDMLAELREDISIALGKSRGKKKHVQILGNLQPVDIDTGDDRRSHSCTFIFSVGSGLEHFCTKTVKERTHYLKENLGFLRQDSFGALCFDDQILGFAFLVRNADNLTKDPPHIQLRLADSHTCRALFSPAILQVGLRFVLVNTPVFAYEPVLNRLKTINQLPLERDILRLQDSEVTDIESFTPSNDVLDILSALKFGFGPRMRLSTNDSPVELDEAQSEALAYALKTPLSVVQGPPGTGKSFIGALVAKIFLQCTTDRILVLSFTNHALDQFLEDLIKIGIQRDVMTRLGSKSTAQTADLSFETQFRLRTDRGGRSFRRVDNLRTILNDHKEKLVSAYAKLVKYPSLRDIFDFLEFQDDADSHRFWAAFQVNCEEDGFFLAGSNNKPVDETHLLERWWAGKGPWIFQEKNRPASMEVWQMKREDRLAKYHEWVQSFRAEQVETFQEALANFNHAQKEIDDWYNEAKCDFIKTKRIIGCTTTAAAKYTSLIKAAGSGCVLVEEAGEILEAHVLTALNPDTKQLVLIGDHKQLRPKCNNYALSVEQGDGYDLNRSMFERLVLDGYPYATLQKQHRMAPEISRIVREMTYPDLLDHPKTEGRPQTLGVQKRVVFINHHQLETAGEGLRDRNDPGQKASKENIFESRMVLSIVRYLVQQGYKLGNMVVLTPYLGQLRRLREALKKEGDLLLSDMDSKELIRAGLLDPDTTQANQGQLRISTIDNYQGEESDIVVASLTRSNERGDIGFMKSPERLNVLVSRARNSLIMIGNMDTFLESRPGRGCWVPFFTMMRENDYLHDGLPVYCEKHPDRNQLLRTPEDFAQKCPDGGCASFCDIYLNCGLHKCPKRCHRGSDHTEVDCQHLVHITCDKKHNYKVKCSAANKDCPKCRKEEEDLRRRMKRDLEIERAREERQAAYRREILEIQDEVERQKKLLRYRQEASEQAKDIDKLRAELTAVKEDNAKHQAVADKEEKNNKASPTAKSRVPRTHEPGSAGEEWQLMKRDEGAKSDELDELMDMIGLEDVKAKFLSIKAEYDTSIRQGVVRGKDRFGCSMLGNPGTGKTTVARLYAKFLTSVGVVAGQGFRETSGSKLANGGVAGCQKLIDEVLGQGGGVIFIDEAYQLSSGNSSGGLAVLDFLLAEVENLTSKVCFILAGYAKQMESFFAHNPGIPSRFPIEMKFADYSDSELLLLLENKIHAVYQGRAKAEDGIRGLYCRIIARRLGRGRGKEGFGNARAVENVLAVIRRRQASRLRRQRRMKPKPDDLLFTKEDLIGPEPSGALSKSKAWSKLQQLTGLQTVKDSIKSLVSSIQANYQREINEEPLIEYTLNRVFLGNPGTGKTTVAKLYGAILVDLTLLSNGEVVVKNPSDFVGAYVGHSESQTNGILAATVGKVLVIDEAYGLYEGKNGSSTGFKTAVVDTIVSTVQNVPGDDRCVLLLGYKDQMEEMFQNVNPGLSRRFPISSAFTFEDFSTSELSTILDLKLGDRGYSVDTTARSVALDVLERARSRPNFGNAGEIDILLNDAVLRHQKRLAEGKPAHRTTFEACDIDEDYDRLGRGGTNIDQLFDGTVGCEKIVSTLKGYQNTVRSMKALDCDPKESIPFNFLFRGPPGTGKTTTARKMAQVFYDAGFLSEVKVLDCSASDLIGEYIGHTGPKVLQLMDKALGRVLLVDEAYRLAEGRFAQEALDEIVDAITKEKYYKKLIIILAGYENDINRLLNANPGLTSRFPEVIDFAEMKPDDCFNLLEKKCKRHKDNLEKNGKGSFDMTCLLSPTTDFRSRTCQLFRTLSAQAGWANARDVETLSGALVKKVVEGWAGDPTGVMQLSEQMITAEMHKMAKERASRAGHNSRLTPVDTSNNFPQQDLPIRPSAPINIPPPAATVPTTTVATPDKAEQSSNESSDECPTPCSDEGGNPLKQSIRDAGVTDEVWEELQRDAEAEEQREKEHEAKVKAKEKAADEATRRRILRELIEDDERRKRAEEMKKKLAKSGRCPMGYAWIQQANGWRCAGGSHFVSELELK